MKTIGIVEHLIRRAKAKAELSYKRDGSGVGVVKQQRRERHYVYGGTPFIGDMREVYRVEYCKTSMSGDTVKLYHYDTLTAEVWLASEPTVMHVYGESRSDADSVNTFLSYFGLPANWAYRPVNGGFMEVK